MGNVYNPQQLAEVFKTLIQGDISVDETDIGIYSKDWSLFTVRPKIILYPKNTEDVQKIVRWVHEHKIDDPTLSVTARAAGSDMTGGPLNDSIIVDVTRYMNKLHGIVKTEHGLPAQAGAFAKVQPGMFYRNFETETLKKGLIMPCYPASRDLAAVGGMVANNGAGEKTLKYGQNKDFVVELEVVLDDGSLCTVKPLTYKELFEKTELQNREGQIYRLVWQLVQNHYEQIMLGQPTTSKNSSGYLLWDVLQAESLDMFRKSVGHFDLTKLFVGAQGTTGIITQITYKLLPTEPMMHSRLVVMFLKNLEPLPNVVDQVLPHQPETFEMYDDNTFKIGVKFFGDFLKHKGFFGALKFAFSFIPELFMAITHGVPKLILMAEFAGEDENKVIKKCKEVSKMLHNLKIRNRITRSENDAAKYWDFRHDSFKILTEHSKKGREGGGTRTAPFIDDLIVDPKHFPEFLPKLEAILKPYNLLYTIAGHIGDGNLHIIPIMDMQTSESKNAVLELIPKVTELVREFSGSMSAEHNDGITRTPFLRIQFGDEMVSLFKKVKEAFDPMSIFNPNKKVGATVEYLKKYLA